jgi:uncharacterized protein
VNPTVDEVLGEKCYKSLLDIPEEIQRTIDVVDVFMKAEYMWQIVELVIELKIRVGRPFCDLDAVRYS